MVEPPDWKKTMCKLNLAYGTQKVWSKHEKSLEATQLSSEVLLGFRSKFNLPSFMKQFNWFLVLDTTSKLQMLDEKWRNLMIGFWHCSLSPNLWNLDILGGSWAMKNHSNASFLMKPTVGHGVSTAKVLNSVIRTHWKPMRRNICQWVNMDHLPT